MILDIVFLQNMQIIIHGKCQIRFSTSKIQNRDLSVLLKFWKNILNKFQKPVDLPEFIKSGMYNFSILCHHTQILEKWNRNSFL